MALIALVTSEVPAAQVQLLASMWEVVEVDPVTCNHKLGLKVSAAVRSEGLSIQ